MAPFVLIAAGVLALAAAIVVLRSFGERYRVGRLLAATPRVAISEALRLAREGDVRYVRVDGRLDSAEDFPDENDRPLVYRRRRLQLRRGRRWESIEDQLDTVPFEVREGLDGIAIDYSALDEGLVVLPRESTGTAGEIPEHVPPGTAGATPARMRIEQISAVEHAAVLGVPVASGEGARLTAGLGRPLILTTLETPEAMRVLGGGRNRSAAVLLLLGAGVGLVAIGTIWALVGGLR